MCEMTVQENDMARCTGEPRALGSGSVHGPCGLANILYHLPSLICVIITHVLLWPACWNWARKWCLKPGLLLNHQNPPFRWLVLQDLAFLLTFLHHALATISALLTHTISWLTDKNWVRKTCSKSKLFLNHQNRPYWKKHVTALGSASCCK